jgi:hypothetical protein
LIRRGDSHLTTLKEGMEAITTIYNYEQKLKREKAVQKANEAAELWNEGRDMMVAFLVSCVYQNEDYVFVSYFMEEFRKRITKTENGE